MRTTGGYQRKLFQEYVVGATDDEIANKIGTPDEVDNKDPGVAMGKKTFDPDNQGDARTIVIFTRDPQDKLRGSDVIFTAK